MYRNDLQKPDKCILNALYSIDYITRKIFRIHEGQKDARSIRDCPRDP